MRRGQLPTTLSGYPLLSAEDRAYHRSTGEQLSKSETLEQALRRCYGNASGSLYSQARAAAIHVSLEAQERGSPCAKPSDWPVEMLLQHDVERITEEDVKNATARFYKDGLSPATINKRLNCLSKMGVSVQGLRVKNPGKLKWYLPEDKLLEVLLWCDQQDYSSLANLIKWTVRTGLRIEESLRLGPDSFVKEFKGGAGDGPLEVRAVKVPGTKTATSQATLPLSTEAALVAWRFLIASPYGPVKMFQWDYEQYQTQWNHVREHFGWQDDPTATLKALRRSAARYLHVDCGMPLHMVQQYLRHESMDTTLEYLRLTGGYGTEEMRRYLK